MKKQKRWEQFRRDYLRALKNHEGYYLCINCRTWVKNVELHHKEKRSVAPDKVFDKNNIMILCPQCHLLLNPDYKKPLQKGVNRGIIL
jgi:5-methylcytosine-specific restriction endonuclease McrA